ncbi:MAG: hypothetical protein JNK72_27200 [Myxococcales bacterium]|nr:hypothetical protein [Myxococcales bacterium]
MLDRRLSLLIPVLVGCNAADAQPRPRTPGSFDAGLSRSNVVSIVPGQAVRPMTGRDCVANRGCTTPQFLPFCQSNTAALTVAEAWDQRLTLRGRAVTVRGQLRAAGGCTEMACSDMNECCNHCQGHIDLVGTGEVRGARVSLGLGLDADALYTCRGDDSGFCCGLEVPPGEVRVTGTLQPIENSGGRFRLANPQPCRPR